MFQSEKRPRLVNGGITHNTSDTEETISNIDSSAETAAKPAKNGDSKSTTETEHGESHSPTVSPDATTAAVKVVSPVAAAPVVKLNSRPAPRRRRNKSGPATRRRTSSSTVSQPVSAAETEENSNTAVSSTTAAGSAPWSASCEASLDDILASTRVPAPAEVGSTHSGTIAAHSQASSTAGGACSNGGSVGFRLPKTKKVT